MYRPTDNPMTIHKALQEKQLQIGVPMLMTMISDPKQIYYLYIPATTCKTSSIFVTIHGINRMAREQIEAFIPFADRYGIAIVAPLFTKKRFPDYQRLGINGKGRRADLTLETILDEISLLTGINTEETYMFGYSGGGQFVHRYAITRPARVKRMVIAASGWYTFPDMDKKYPYGIAKTAKMKEISMEPNSFLTIPVCVIVGEKDKLRDRLLRKEKNIDQQQGQNRIERGIAWVKAMQKCCHSYDLRTQYKFHLLKDSNHSFLNCINNGDMGAIVFDFLLGDTHSNTRSISIHNAA